MTSQQAIRDAKARWARRRRRELAYGTWRPFVDAQPVREHVQAIRATGLSLVDLAAATGVNRGSLDHLLWGSDGIPPAAKLRPETAEALLNYWPVLDDYSDGSHIDPTGTVRRVHALAALGWTWTAIANHIGGWCRSTFERLTYDKPVTAALARAIRDMYDEVSSHPAEHYGTTPWVAERARNRARRQNWPDPTFWEDYGGIDDPDAPETEPEAERGPRADAHHRAEEARHLARFGISTDEIAQRLGYSTDYVRQILTNRGPGWREQQKEAAA